jgi:hypothetical protein
VKRGVASPSAGISELLLIPSLSLPVTRRHGDVRLTYRGAAFFGIALNSTLPRV